VELIHSFSAAPFESPHVEDQLGFARLVSACVTESSRHRFGPAGRVRRVDPDERVSPVTCEDLCPPSERHDLVRDYLHAATGTGKSQARFAGPGRAQDGCAPSAPGEPRGMQQVVAASGEEQREAEVQDFESGWIGSGSGVDSNSVAIGNAQERLGFPEDRARCSGPLPEEPAEGRGLRQWTESARRRDQAHAAPHQHRAATRSAVRSPFCQRDAEDGGGESPVPAAAVQKVST